MHDSRYQSQSLEKTREFILIRLESQFQQKLPNRISSLSLQSESAQLRSHEFFMGLFMSATKKICSDHSVHGFFGLTWMKNQIRNKKKIKIRKYRDNFVSHSNFMID